MVAIKILITNTNCSWNKGSEALVLSTAFAFEKAYKNNIRFILISSSYEFDLESAKNVGDVDLHICGYPVNESRHRFIRYMCNYAFCILLSVIQRFLFLNKVKLNERFLRAYNEADLVVDLSGDTLADHPGLNGIALLNLLAFCPALILKKPYVVYSQSIGPFKWYSKPLVSFFLRKAKAVLLREKISLEVFRSLEVKNDNVFLQADCAFALEPALPDRVAEIWKLEGLEKVNKPFVGMAVSRLMESLDNNYVSFMAELADYIIEELKVKLIFIPHVASPRGHGFDSDARDTQKKVFERLANKSEAVLVNGDYGARELKGLIGLCDLFVSSYMHAGIAALSSAVPTVVLGWSHKYKGIMAMVGMDNFVFDYKSHNSEQIAIAVKQMWENRADVRLALVEKADFARKSALEAAEIVRQVLEKEGVLLG